jgi:hypothetical protein
MDKLKYILFETKRQLHPEEAIISQILENHFNQFDNYSSLTIFNSLKESLYEFDWSKNAMNMLVEMEKEIKEEGLYYELQNLYYQIQDEAKGDIVYDAVLSTIMEIMNRDSDEERMKGIVHELNQFTWVKPVREFMMRYTDKPISRENLSNSNGGESHPVYTISESVQGGSLVSLHDKWFIFREDSIEVTALEAHCDNPDRCAELRLIKDAIANAEITEDCINFQVDDDVVLGIDVKTSKFKLNGEEVDDTLSIETIFNSPMIPFNKRILYPAVIAVANNLHLFVHLDPVIAVTSYAAPNKIAYLFNYCDCCYCYMVDSQMGSGFYEYSNCNDLISEIKEVMGFDATFFFKDKASIDTKIDSELSDREAAVKMELDDTEEMIDKMEKEFGDDLVEPENDVETIETEFEIPFGEEDEESGFDTDVKTNAGKAKDGENDEKDEEDEEEKQALESIKVARELYGRLKVKRMQLKEKLEIIRESKSYHRTKIIREKLA